MSRNKGQMRGGGERQLQPCPAICVPPPLLLATRPLCYRRRFDQYPNPPVGVLSKVEALLGHHDPELCKAFRSGFGGCQGHAWTLMQTAFSEVFSRKASRGGREGGMGFKGEGAGEGRCLLLIWAVLVATPPLPAPPGVPPLFPLLWVETMGGQPGGTPLAFKAEEIEEEWNDLPAGVGQDLGPPADRRAGLPALPHDRLLHPLPGCAAACREPGAGPGLPAQAERARPQPPPAAGLRAPVQDARGPAARFTPPGAAAGGGAHLPPLLLLPASSSGRPHQASNCCASFDLRFPCAVPFLVGRGVQESRRCIWKSASNKCSFKHTEKQPGMPCIAFPLKKIVRWVVAQGAGAHCSRRGGPGPAAGDAS